MKMITDNAVMVTQHPCWSELRDDLWERIHLPIAPYCNVKCVYCDHSIGASCHLPRPAAASRIFTVKKAVRITLRELSKRTNLRVIAISGPGEPLANSSTFDFLQRIRRQIADCEVCLSTNGLILSEKLDVLLENGVSYLTVSMSTVDSTIANKLYEWIEFDHTRLVGEEKGGIMIERQLRGISEASDAGIRVKVNSVLIPGMTDDGLTQLAKKASSVGASIQNIIALRPLSNLLHHRAPTRGELLDAQKRAASFIPQFTHCALCRSDVVGIPGADEIL